MTAFLKIFYKIVSIKDVIPVKLLPKIKQVNSTTTYRESVSIPITNPATDIVELFTFLSKAAKITARIAQGTETTEK